MLGDYLGEVHWGFKDNAAQPCPRDGAQMRWANEEEVDEIDELVCGGDNRQAEVAWAFICPVCGGYVVSIID